MDYVRKISALYRENILLHAPYQGDGMENIPGDLETILRVSNGIQETMPNPKTGEKMPITWILYPYDQILEESHFYKMEYGIEGVVFTSDGAGNPYLQKPDGKIVCFHVIDNEETEIADSLSDFYK